MERSREAVQDLDTEAVAGLRVGTMIYGNTYFARHALGEAATASGGSVHLAVELPERCRNAHMLLVTNLVQISYLLERHPEMASAVPSFMGAISVEGDERRVSAVLTEDITQGGRFKADPDIADERFRKSIQLPTDAHGPYAPVTAQVADRTEILGFFPPPFSMNLPERYRLDMYIPSAMDGLTIGIPADSELAASLNRPDGTPG